MLRPFSCTCWSFVWFLGKISVQFLCPFFKIGVVWFLFLSCVSFLCIYIYINPYLKYSLQIFSLSFCRLPFHFCRLFLLQCRAFSLMYQVSLVNFCLVLLCHTPKNLVAKANVKEFSLFSFRSFIYRVLCLSLLIYFRLILCVV